jgi:hypothetical protein
VEIGCGTDAADFVNEGCPGFPSVFNNITHYKGLCKCYSPAVSTNVGMRISNEIISNRMVPEMKWIMEPWQTGPPYDLALSYKVVCSETLERLGCPEEDRVSYADTDGIFECTCGDFDPSTAQVQNIITDQLNKIPLSNMPIFDSPVVLSVPMTVCMILICGKLGSIVAVYFKLPAILGYVLVGLGLQNFLNPMVLKGVGFPYPSLESEIKQLCMTVVLMRAGLAVDLADIKNAMVPCVVYSLLPYMAEFFGFMYTGVKMFGWPAVEMGLFAAMMAALGPSVVIPPMLVLLSNPKKNYGYIPKQILICAPLEAVIAFVLFAVFTILNQSERDPVYPWVEVLPLYANCLLIPVNICFSIVLGVIVGYFVSQYINWRVTVANDLLWLRINKNLQMGSSTADLIFVLYVSCYTMLSLATKQYIQQCSGVLVVFTTCVSVSVFCDKTVAKDIAVGLKGIWVFGEAFIFTFVGTSLTLDSTNGPLEGQRGMDGATFKNLIACMLVGTAARFICHIISAVIVVPSMPEHRRNFAWMSRFAITAYSFQLPKATVQATIGGLAYTLAIIPGAQGVNKGFIMLQSSAISILIFASLGTMIINYFASPICLQCSKMDEEAGWDNKNLRYLKTSKYYKGDLKADIEAGDDDDENSDETVSVEMAPSHTHYTKSAAGLYVPEEENRRRTETVVDLIHRALQVATGPQDTSGPTRHQRSRSVSQAVRYVFAGDDEEQEEDGQRADGRRRSISEAVRYVLTGNDGDEAGPPPLQEPQHHHPAARRRSTQGNVRYVLTPVDDDGNALPKIRSRNNSLTVRPHLPLTGAGNGSGNGRNGEIELHEHTAHGKNAESEQKDNMPSQTLPEATPIDVVVNVEATGDASI